MMAQRGTNGLPFVAGSGYRHTISNGHAASSCMVTGANASESRRPRVGTKRGPSGGKSAPLEWCELIIPFEPLPPSSRRLRHVKPHRDEASRITA
jgi:hypothetical protein